MSNRDNKVAEASQLALGVTSKLVSSFDSLIKFINETKADDSLNSDIAKVEFAFSTAGSVLHGKLFDQELYNSAINLSEREQVVLDKIDKFSDTGYGSFSGGTTYSDFTGTKNSDNKPSANGWFTLSDYTGQYGIFNSDTSYIISSFQFTPQSTISDFMPLYILLSTRAKSGSRFKDDVTSAFSLATNDKQNIADNLTRQGSLSASHSFTPEGNTQSGNNTSKVAPDVQPVSDKSEIPTQDSANNTVTSADNAKIPSEQDVNKEAARDTKSSEKDIDIDGAIQAIIYDMPGTAEYSNSILRCYQQPDSVSYNTSSSYEPVSTRGSQQPLQFYQSANAIEMSFTLKFHRDELDTLDVYKYNNSSSQLEKQMTLASIVDVAEGFTRPWAAGDSVVPKEVMVILPGVTAKGYMTSVSATYSGSLTADAADVKTPTAKGAYKNDIFKIGNLQKGVYNYSYDSLELSFTMTVISDVKLSSKREVGTIENPPKKDGDTSDSSTSTDTTVDKQDANIDFGWASKEFIKLDDTSSDNIECSFNEVTHILTTNGTIKHTPIKSNDVMFLKYDCGVEVYIGETTEESVQYSLLIMTGDHSGSVYEPAYSIEDEVQYDNEACKAINSLFPKQGVVVTQKDPLKVRKEPDGSAKVIGSLSKGASVSVYGEVNNWYKVPMSSVKKISASSGSKKAKPTTKYEVTKEVVGMTPDGSIMYIDGTIEKPENKVGDQFVYASSSGYHDSSYIAAVDAFVSAGGDPGTLRPPKFLYSSNEI